MRLGFDSTDPSGVPADVPSDAILLGYDSGAWQSYGGLVQRFPGHKVVSIAVQAAYTAKCLDVESGDATPEQAPGWVERMRAAGDPYPWVYFSFSNRGAIDAAFASQGVAPALYWGAGYATPPDPTIPAGYIGHQYADAGPYDASVFIDFISGFDAPAVKNRSAQMLIGDGTKAVMYLLGSGKSTVVHTTEDVNRLEFIGVPNAGWADPLTVISWMKTFGAWTL